MNQFVKIKLNKLKFLKNESKFWFILFLKVGISIIDRYTFVSKFWMHIDKCIFKSVIHRGRIEIKSQSIIQFMFSHAQRLSIILMHTFISSDIKHWQSLSTVLPYNPSYFQRAFEKRNLINKSIGILFFKLIQTIKNETKVEKGYFSQIMLKKSPKFSFFLNELILNKRA